MGKEDTGLTHIPTEVSPKISAGNLGSFHHGEYFYLCVLSLA